MVRKVTLSSLSITNYLKMPQNFGIIWQHKNRKRFNVQMFMKCGKKIYVVGVLFTRDRKRLIV